MNRDYLSQYVGLKQVTNEETPDQSLIEENKTTVDTWIQGLGDFDINSDDHIKKCFNHAGSLDTQEQDQTQYIMNSQSFQDWLAKPATSLLEVRSETAPENLINVMTLSTAMLALTLGASNFAVLSFFCGLRRSESFSEEAAGEMGILKSLNGQLLKFILAKQPNSALGIQKSKKVWRKSSEEPKYAKALFKHLLSLLPEGSVVFVLLDSVSRVYGAKDRVDKLVERILDGAKQQANRVVVKMLVTDALPSSRIKKLALHSIYVPDDVDGWNCGMNMTLVEQSNKLKLRGLEKRKQLVQRASSEESSDDDDSEDDESS